MILEFFVLTYVTCTVFSSVVAGTVATLEQAAIKIFFIINPLIFLYQIMVQEKYL